MQKRRGRPSNISRAAALLGSRGGKIGGARRAAALTLAQRTAIAKLAAIARWSAREVQA